MHELVRYRLIDDFETTSLDVIPTSFFSATKSFLDVCFSCTENWDNWPCATPNLPCNSALALLSATTLLWCRACSLRKASSASFKSFCICRLRWRSRSTSTSNLASNARYLSSALLSVTFILSRSLLNPCLVNSKVCSNWSRSFWSALSVFSRPGKAEILTASYFSLSARRCRAFFSSVWGVLAQTLALPWTLFRWLRQLGPRN